MTVPSKNQEKYSNYIFCLNGITYKYGILFCSVSEIGLNNNVVYVHIEKKKILQNNLKCAKTYVEKLAS